jgi:outer membrane lipoprotein-sorting protein
VVNFDAMKNKLALIFVMLTMLTLGCKLSSLMPGGGGGSGGGTATGGSDPKADIIAASKKFIDLKSFTANMEGMGQTEIKSQVEYLAPDRFHIKYLGGTGAGMEMVVIGSDMFMKTAGSNKWSKMPGNGASIPNLRDSFTEEGLKTLSDVKFEGEETVDGKAALVYSYKNQTPKGGYPFTSTTYVGKESGLPMKIVVDYSNGVLKTMTVTYDTETPVTIEAPAR